MLVLEKLCLENIRAGFFTGQMHFQLLNQHGQCSEGKKNKLFAQKVGQQK